MDPFEPIFNADEPIVIRVRHELPEHAQRLLATIGAGYVIDERAPPCASHCGYPECRVTETVARRAVPLGEAIPPYMLRRDRPAEPAGPAKTPEERRQEEAERADAQPIRTQCGICGWSFEGTVGEGRAAAIAHREERHPELDAAPGPRRGISRWTRSANDEREREAAMVEVERRQRTTHADDDGRGALDRMDAGEPQQPQRVTARGRVVRARGYWTRETIIEALQAYAREHGHAPTTTLLAKVPVPDGLPAFSTVRKFGKYDDLLAAAGLAKPPRSSRRGSRSRRLEREAAEGSERQGAPTEGSGAGDAAPTPAAALPDPEEKPVTALAVRDPIRTADIPYDADVLEAEAAYLRQRAAALETIAGGIRALAAIGAT